MKKSSQKSKPQFKPNSKSTCPTLSNKSILTYELGQDSAKALHLRITANDGGGFFSTEWVPWKRIEAAIGKTTPITSICLRSLFTGKSVNTSGFLLAVLLAEGIVEPLPKKLRQFKVTGKSLTAKPSTKRKASAKKTRK